MIKFWVKLKKMVTEMKKILDAAHKSAMSQASVYHRYNEFKSGGRVRNMSRLVAPMTVLTEQSTLAHP